MKKIFAFIVYASMVTLAFAQDSTKSDTKFRFGFKVAPSLAWLKPDVKGYESDGSIVGFIYGLMMDYNLSKNYALNVGLEVSYRGGKLKYEEVNNSNVSFSGKSTYYLKYVELPFSLKMKTNEIGYLTYYGQIGLQPGLNIDAKKDSETTTNNPSQSPNTQSGSDIDISNEIVDFNFSLVLGIGIEYRISGNTSILAGLQFSNGFTDLTKADDVNGISVKAISNYFALNIGVFF